MNKFKVGDVLVVPFDERDRCGTFYQRLPEAKYVRVMKITVNGYVFYDILDGQLNPISKCSGCFSVRFHSFPHYEGAEPISAPINFILQYELDRVPFETFATMKEVEARIKELAKRADLKRESIKVYEIAKTYDVKLETRVIFGGTKVKLTENAPVKRGRPVRSKNSRKKCPDCGTKVKGNLGLAQHRRWQHGSITKQTA